MTQPNLSNFSIASKTYGTDTTFSLTDPTSNSSGAFTFTSGNTQVATISGRTVTIIGPGTSVITASQAAAGGFTAASTTASLVVAFGNLTSLSSKVLTDGPFVIPAPTSNVVTTYGTTWNQLGANIYGENAGDNSGYSVSMSADGTIVAIGAFVNDGSGNLLYDSGHVRVYKYTPGKGAVTNQNDASFGPVGWTRLGADIDGEAVGDRAGGSVSLSADGTVVAIGAQWNDGSGNGINDDRGHVRVYKYNPNKTVAQLSDQSLSTFGPAGWDRLGADIDGESDDTFSFNVSLSADGTVVAIGAFRNDGSGNGVDDNRGHVRVYKYTPGKAHITNQNDASFGPVGWTRLGADIDGETAGDYSGFNVSISADGTTVAIGAFLNDGYGNLLSNSGHVRVYKYTPGKADVTNQNDTSFGPVGWTRLGADIDGEAANDLSGWSVSLSADGTTVAIGAQSAGTYRGHVRVYKYTPGKGAVTNQNDATFGPVGWTRLGADIDGEAAGDQSGYSVSMSTDGTIVAIGAPWNNEPVTGAGQVRIYKYNPNKTVAQLSEQSLSTFGPAGWDRLGADIDGDATVSYDESGYSVSLSADGTTVAIGAVPGSSSFPGTVRVFKIDSSGNYTYTIGNSTVADICGNIVLPKLGGSTTINVTQSASGANTSKSATVPLTIIASPTFQTYTVASKTYGTDTTFSLTDPTSNSSGAFTFTSGNTQVATISGSTVTIIGPGTSVITASQAAAGGFTAASTTASLVVAFGNLSSLSSKVFTDGPFVIPPPLSNVATTYGTTWVQRGADIDGEAAEDYSGESICVSADGTIVAIGSRYNTATGPYAGHVRVYKYNASKTVAQTNQSLANFGPIGWDRLGDDIDSEASRDAFGVSVSLSADGTVVAIGAMYNDGGGTGSSTGHVRVYKYNASKSVAQTNQSLANFGPAGWDRLGVDIDGEAAGDNSGVSVSLSSDGTVVAIGARYNAATGSNAGHVRVYKYNASKSGGITDQSLTTFGPAGWDRLGVDIDGEAANDHSGVSVSLSADGTVLAIGAWQNNDNTGHVRVYKYNASKSVAQTNQSLANFGPAGWDRLGVDIDGEAANDYSGFSVSLSADGTVLAIGAIYNDGGGTGSSTGHVRVYKYNASKSVAQTNQSLANFGPAGWDRLGVDIDGEAAYDQSGFSVSMSSDGTMVAIGARFNAATGPNAGHVRVYKYNASKSVAQTNQSLANFGPIGWDRLGVDIDGEAAQDQSGSKVSLSADGTVLAISAGFNDGTASNAGHVRVYKIDSYGNYTYTIDNSAIADICGNIVLPKSVGSTTITVTQSASGSYTSKSATVPLITVNQIAPTIGTLTAPAKNFRDASFNLTAPTSNSSGAFSYTSSNAAVATVTSGGVVTVVGVGSATITATQDATTNYLSGSVTASLVVSAIAPTFGTFTVPTKNFRDAAFSLTAPTTDSSGAFTYTSNTPSVATVTSGGVVTVVGAGSATISAVQDACGNFTSGTVTGVLVVSAIAPTFGTFTVPGKNFGDAAFSLTAPTTDSSGAFTYSSNAPSVATVTSGGVVTVVGAGSATISAVQDACGNYLAGSQTGTLTVNRATPTYQAVAEISKTYGTDASFSLTAVLAGISNSSGAYTFTCGSGAISISGAVATILAYTPSAITITASQDASGNYLAGSKTFTLLVNRATPTYQAVAEISKTYGIDVSFSLASVVAGISNSSGAYTFSSASGAVSISGAVVTILAYTPSAITITATQDASGNYAASSTTVSLLVGRGEVTYQSVAQITKTYSTDVSFSLTSIMAGVSNSSGAYTFSSASNAIDICGGVATIIAYTPSAITITASQGASGNYTASSTTFTLLISRKTPSYGEFSIPAKTYGNASFSVVPYAPTTDSLSVPYTYTSSDPAVATINSNGTVVTIIGQGYTTITASQEASGNYAANSSTSSFLVNRAAPTFLKAFTIPDKTFGDASFSLLPFTEGLDNTDGTYHFTSSNSELVSISNTDDVTATIHAYTPTPITIYVAIDACGNYAASSTSGTLNVGRDTPTIGTLTVPAKNFRATSFTLSAPTSDSSGAFTYTIDASGVEVASVTSGGLVTVIGAGNATITATQAVSGNYTSGSVSATLVVSPIAPTFGTFTVPGKLFRDASFNLTAPTTDSSGSFTYTSNTPSVATVTSGGLVTVVGTGSATISAVQDACGNFTARTVTGVLVVSAIAPTFGTFTVPTKNFRDTAFSLTAPTTDSSGAFSYTSNTPSVATVTSGGVVTVVGAGSATISVVQDACGNFTTRTATGVLVVSAIAPTFGTFTVPGKLYRDVAFSLTAPSTDSSGSFTYTFDASDAWVATVTSGGRVNVVGTGSATISAVQDACGNFTARTVTGVLVVSAIAPTFGTFTVPTKNFRDTAFSLTAPSTDSSGAFTYTIDASESSVATVTSGGLVTVVGVGSATISVVQGASGNFTSRTVTGVLVVSPIAPTFGTFTVPTKNFRDAAFSLTAPSTDSSGSFTYSSNTPSVATVTSGGLVTVVGAGSATISVVQDACGNFTTRTVTGVLVVSPISPTIGALTVPAKNFGDAAFSLSAPTTDSSGSFTYTINTSGADAGVATVTSGGVVTIVGAGSATITATQDACGNFTTRTVTGVLVVSVIAPTYQSITQITKTYSTDVSFSLTSIMAGVSNSSGAYTFSSASNAIDICGGVATILAYTPSAITITASQGASINYLAGSKTFTLLISRKTPSYGEFSIPAKTYGNASFSVVPYAPTTDSLSVPYTYTSSDPAVATINSNGTVATIIGQGYTTITVSQEASGNYAANSTTTSFLVNRAAPTFLKAFTIPDKTFGDASFSLLPFTEGLDNTDGTYHFTSSNAELVSISTVDNVTAVIHAYTPTPITIYVAIDACGNYAASSTSGTLNVDRAAPTIGTLTAPPKNFRDASFTLSAPTSDSSGAFTYTSSNTAVATVTSGGLVTVVGAGSATITATLAASGNYTSGSVTAALVVSPIAPTFGTFTVPGKNFRDASFNLTAPTTDSSGVFTYSSNAPSVATVTSGGRVTVVGTGSATITATQDASGNFTARTVTAALVVSPIAPTFGTFTVPGKNFRDAAFSLTAPTTDSSGAFTYSSNAPTVATVTSGGLVTVVGAGSATISVVQDACGNFTARTVTGVLVVSPIEPTFGTFTVPTKNFRAAAFSLTAPITDSSGAFIYTIDASESGVATVTSDGRVTVVGVGSAIITTTQDACGNFTARTVTGMLVVSSIEPTFGTFTVPPKNYRDDAFSLTAPTTDSSGAFTYNSSSYWVASVTSGGVVTIVGTGRTSISATQASSGNFTSRTVTGVLVISPIAPSFGTFTVPPKYFNDSTFYLTRPTTDSFGSSIYYSSNTPSVATVTYDGSVTMTGVGSTTITATQGATDNFTSGTVTGVLVVSPATPVITLSTITKNYGDASFNIQPSSTNTDVTGYNGDGLGRGLISFSSGNSNIVTIFDTSYVGIVGIGSANITMSQTATTNFTSGSGTVMATINKGTPVLSAFTVSSNRTYGSAPFSALTIPTSVSNGAITYSQSDANIATIDNSGVITLLAAGYVTFTATQASTAFYNLVTKASNTMTVHKQALPLTRVSPTSSIINKIYGDSYFNVSATNASNGGAITYETDNSSVCGVINSSTGVISVVSVGTATITARREQTAQYTSDPVSWTVEVARATTTLTGLVDLSYNVTSAPFTVTASSVSNGAVTYSLQSPSSEVLTIHPTTGRITLLTPGTAVIVASQAQSSLYLATANITATITVTSAGSALQGATLTSTSSFASVDLSGASLAGVTISNTTFNAAKLSNANLTNAVIVSANFTSANLTGATLAGATITGATFTSASLKNADLSGATLTSTVFTGSDLSGARLTGVDASGASFANAKLNNVDMTGANVQNVNFTNTSIKGAIIADISFSPLQKLQLLKNSENRDIGQIIIPAVSGTTILSAISETSPLRAIANLDLTSASVSVAVVIPTTSTSPTEVLPDVVLNVTDNDKFYLPINEGEYFQIDGVKYSTSGGVVRNYVTNAVVEVIQYGGKPVWLLAGSIVGLVLLTNSLNTASFVVPSHLVFTNLTPFMPTTLPTTNSESTIVYSSNNTYIASINSSSGLITLTGHTGVVNFTATQVQNSTHEPGSITSNYMTVGTNINFSLIGLNQSFDLSTLALLDSSSVNLGATDAAAIFYVRLSDINNVFKYQTDATDVNDISSSDIKYYVFHRKWPAELKINPSHAMMNKAESVNSLGSGEGYTSNKSLMKHDFIRYIALRLFNTIHGVDLFRNESDILENSVYWGETVRHNIDGILSGISTTSNSETMPYDASGNKYLTNDSSGNTNLSRELMRQVAAGDSSRFYNNGENNSGLKNIPFLENDTIIFKVILQAAAGQNILTGVSEIPSRSYTVKLVLKNTVTAVTNANTVIVDSEMYPNSYPYSSSVTTYAPTSESSGVYNIYSPPAPIPFSRFGFNGWYYMNSSAWVGVAPAVRNHIKWIVSANTGSSTVGDIQYVRLNLKIHNNASLPYLMIYTQAGSSRKYAVSGGNGSLTNGTVYSLYINLNSYTREPAMTGYTNAALVYTIGSGTFANNESITSFAVETDSNATASNVEFTLASIIVGELSTTTGVTTEKEYGFEADIPVAYP